MQNDTDFIKSTPLQETANTSGSLLWIIAVVAFLLGVCGATLIQLALL